MVGGVLSRNGASTTTPPRTAMLSVKNSRSFARTSRRSSKAWLITWRWCISLVRSTCSASGALTWRNRLRRRHRRLPLSRFRSGSPSAPNALNRLRQLRLMPFPRHLRWRLPPLRPHLHLSPQSRLPLAFRVFQCIHGDSCGDVASPFSLTQGVYPDGCGQRSDQQLPRPCAYTRNAGPHVRRRRPSGPSHDRRPRQHLLKGVTKGTIFCPVTDDNGKDRRVSFRVRTWAPTSSP